ncbi:MAG: biopolymer transporter ExbD [Ramlibacter sp.]
MPATIHRGGRRRTISEINMVPFIDVMLVLLIIFMVTAPLIAPSMIKLPTVDTGQKPPERLIEIVIGKDESIQLKEKGKSNSMTLAQAVDAAKKAQGEATNGDSAVVISADGSVKYENVLKARNELKKAGVNRVGLLVQSAK